MPTTVFSIFAALALFAAGGFAAMPAHAAETVCKGLATQVCSGNAACSWVKPYKTKKGKDIAGFCRKKVTRKPAQAKTTG
jgi:hypothetical protein